MRAHPPPLTAPRPTAAPRAGRGARAQSPRPPGLPGPALSAAAPRAHAHVPGAHTPSGPEHPGRPGVGDPPPHPFSLLVPVPLRVSGGSQVPKVGNVASFGFTWRGEAYPLLGIPHLVGDCRGGLSGFVESPNLWSASPSPWQHLYLAEGIRFLFRNLGSSRCFFSRLLRICIFPQNCDSGAIFECIIIRKIGTQYESLEFFLPFFLR